MRYEVSNIVRDIDRKLHTGGTSQTRDFFGALDEGRRRMIGNIKPPEMERVIKIEQALYDQIEQYAVPLDLQYSSVVSIKKVSAKRNIDTLENPIEYVYRRRFDQRRRGAKNVFTVVYDGGKKYMKLDHPTGLKEKQDTVINDVNSLTDNGTWNTGGNLVNLQLDKLNFITGKASLRFDFNNSGTAGFIENMNMTSVDINDYMELGAVFTWFNISSFQDVTSVKITLFSSLTDSYSFTVNQPHDSNQFNNGWNLLKFPLDGLTVTGIPNPKAIIGIRIDFTTTGNPFLANNFDNIVARKGSVYEIVYDSAYCFIDPVTLEWKQFATQGSDIIPLEEDSYQILMLETADVIMQEALVNFSREDIDKLQTEKQTAYFTYERNHKSESIEPHQTGYVLGNMYDGYTDTPMDGEVRGISNNDND